MISVLYLGCPAVERAETETLLTAAGLSIVWAEDLTYAFAELQRRDVPVLLDLSRGSAALQAARELREQHPNTLTFAVVDNGRPDWTTEAVLAGVADVFPRPLGGRRVANAIKRELAYGSNQAPPEGGIYHHSSAMREVVGLIARAATMRGGVTVQGESGTGRQLIARAIHAA